MSRDASDRPILLIDSLNLFTRHFSANPATSSFGMPMGGVVGYLNALKKLVQLTRPSDIIVAWEGGGSKKRRTLFSEYKAHRRPSRLNRFYEDDIPNTVENRNDQIKSLIACLKCVPVRQIYVSDCEADDVIAHVCRIHFHGQQKVIVSSDKDFYQLLDDNVKIYSPGRKIFVTKDDIVRDFGISPANFSLAKALVGDTSDNISGIKNVGFKTLAKRFPELVKDHVLNVDDVLMKCREMSEQSKIKLYKNILEGEQLIRRNEKLVTLDGSMLVPDQVKKIDYLIDAPRGGCNKIDMIRELVSIGLGDFNVDTFFYELNSVTM